MPKSSPLQSDFRGGEISPFSQGRVEAPWYKKSLALCLNWMPTIQGGITRRPGTRFVGTVKTQANYTRLIPFVVSATKAYMLEFGNNYIRVWNSDGTFSGIELATTFLTAELKALRYVQHNDYLNSYLYIVHPLHAPYYVRLQYASIFGGGDFWGNGSISFVDGPYVNVDPTVTTFTLTVAGTPTLQANNVNGINGGNGFQASDVGRHVRIYQTRTTSINNATDYQTVASPIAGGWGGWNYKQVAIAPAAGVGTISQEQVGWATIAVVTNTTTVQLTAAISGSAFISGTVPDKVSLGLFCPVNGYPSAVTIHEGRIFYGGVVNYGKRFDGSATQLFNVFSPSDLITLQPTDDKALNFTIFSEDANVITWMKSVEHGLLCGTDGDEVLIRPSNQDQSLSPTNVSAKVNTAYGSASADAVKVGKGIIFAQRYGKKIREAAFDFYSNGYKSVDRTLHHEHILGAGGIVEMAYQKGPLSTVWCVRTDGIVAAMTHEEEDGEIVSGWHRHQLGGLNIGSPNVAVESVAVIPSSDASRDVVWFAVKRTTAGGTLRTIERMEAVFDQFTSQLNAFYLDCGQGAFGGPVGSVNVGASFNSEILTIYGDGKPEPPATVVAGVLTFPQNFSTYCVGYPYNSDLQLLRYESGSAEGAALGKLRRTHRLGMLLLNTLCLKIGSHFNNLTELFFRDTTILNDVATPLFSGVRVETLDADMDFDNQLCLRVSEPVPATILAVIPRMDTQDAE